MKTLFVMTLLTVALLAALVLLNCRSMQPTERPTIYRHYDSKQRFQGQTICRGERCRSYDSKGRFKGASLAK